MISVNYCNLMGNVILLNEHSTNMSTPMNPHIRNVAVPNDWDRRGLPGWAYHSPALLELEKEHVFRNHWQIAGHVSDVPNEGDYLTIDVVGERALIVRGKDGVVRGFHNHVPPPRQRASSPTARAPARTRWSARSTAGSTISTARCAAPHGRAPSRISTRPSSA